MASFITACLVFITHVAMMQTAPSAPRDETAHARALIAALVAKDVAKIEEQFDEKMRTALPSGRLAAMWDTVLTQAGAYKRCAAESRVRAIADKQMVITACEFDRATLDFQFAFDPQGRLCGLAMRPAARPDVPYTLPAYAMPASYTEGELTVASGSWPLPATLDMPVGPGPFSAIVLVHGSGPNDRDETVMANKPFKDLALGLASRGIVVLRYDKRTKVYGARLAGLADFTVQQEVIEDALAAVNTLRAQPRIDPARVYVLGHSLGGMTIPRIATGDASLAGVIVMAGAARPLDQAILEQTQYLAMADGRIVPEEQTRIDEAKTLVETVKALTPEDAKSAKPVFGAPASYWLDLRGYDAPVAAKSINAPMLVLQGERDYQVTMEEFARWKAALAGKRNVTFHSYLALNHLFIAGGGKSLPAAYETPGHVDEAVVRDIADWIKR